MIISPLIWTIPVLVVIGIIVSTVYRLKEDGVSVKKTVLCVETMVISIVLVVSVFVPIIIATDPAITIDYDDYIEVESTVLDTSGSMETVVKNDVTYVHAKDIGYGTVSYSNGNVTEYNVQKADLDVFMLGGQSNIAYWPIQVDEIDTPPNPTCDPGQGYYFGTSFPYTQGKELTYCLIRDITDFPDICRFEMPFSAQYYEKTGNKALTVNVAIGGKSIEEYQPGTEHFIRSVTAWEMAISLIDYSKFNVTIGGLIWCQGEADTYQTVDWYKTRFGTMMDAYGSIDTPIEVCYIDLIRPIRGQNSYYAQIELANELDNVYLATDVSNTFSIENGCLQDDEVHYTQKGHNMIGIAVADFISKQEVE